MILKASQRGGGKQLGQHLLRTDENEHVELHDIRGFVSDDVVGALKEAYAVSRGTRCKQFLFSVSLSPPQQECVSVDTFEDAISRIEDKNGLTGQPRVIVFHEKEGRRHCHAVWSRIDAETMTAKNLSHFKLKLRDLSRELYIENGWKLPRGLMNSREADPRNFTLAEWQQAKRMGRDARDLKAMMQECWAASDSRASFAQALKARGITLAKGDRRGFVAVTHEGETLSISRYTGKKTKEINARLGEPKELPSVEEAKAQFAKDLTAAFQRHQGEAEERKRRALSPLETKRQHMAGQHRLERAKLKDRQHARWADECRSRAARFDTGVKGIWSRITGKHAQIRKQNEREAFAALRRDGGQRQRLIDAQLSERQALQEQIRTVRGRHAELLRELRQDRRKVRELNPRLALSQEFAKRSGGAAKAMSLVHARRMGQAARAAMA
ncbi:Relaxase/mobilization nuclease domain protein [Methyloligella halotolerans]|uniref:Relaxase/mobilization nuclease domain protein n=1 Tax=Methyloligella halotolerans TaxID=1177755 RepID=A0A1E2RWE4_9HYPH|nr:relaxase/mobilization nuclease domain-containing protein [Methyloligella halotolerans]ODA66576.1 Relaxase/mobilization nuclease domain protein [Methyloligella halotolerans]